MAVAKLDLRDVMLDLDGFLSSGGKIYTYAANTLTPLATYLDADGTENENPVEADSSGQAHIWLTVGLAYKFVFKTAEGVTIYTENGVKIPDRTSHEVSFCYLGEYAGGETTLARTIFNRPFVSTVTYPPDFEGSVFLCDDINEEFEATIYRSGEAVGTLTIDADDEWIIDTDGEPITFQSGDWIRIVGPEGAVDVTNISGTFLGAIE